MRVARLIHVDMYTMPVQLSKDRMLARAARVLNVWGGITGKTGWIPIQTLA